MYKLIKYRGKQKCQMGQSDLLMNRLFNFLMKEELNKCLNLSRATHQSNSIGGHQLLRAHSCNICNICKYIDESDQRD